MKKVDLFPFYPIFMYLIHCELGPNRLSDLDNYKAKAGGTERRAGGSQPGGRRASARLSLQ